MSTSPDTTDIVLPDAQFGMSNTRHNVSEIRHGTPERDIMEAANRFNAFRFRKLTAPQRVFVDEYLANGFDATLAAKAAKYRDHEIISVGAAMMKKRVIREAIFLATDYYAKKSEIRARPLLEEMHRIALATLEDLYSTVEWVDEETGEPQTKVELSIPPPGSPLWSAIKEIVVEHGVVKSIKYHDKLAAVAFLHKAITPQAKPVAGAGMIEADRGAEYAPTDRVNVINLIPVPSGQFLPAPIAPTGEIRKSPLLDLITKREGVVVPEAEVSRLRVEAR